MLLVLAYRNQAHAPGQHQESPAVRRESPGAGFKKLAQEIALFEKEILANRQAFRKELKQLEAKLKAVSDSFKGPGQGLTAKEHKKLYIGYEETPLNHSEK